MNTKRVSSRATRLSCTVAAAGLSLCAGLATAGTWTKVTNNAPASVSLMLLLSDGTVMAAGTNNNTWYRLTPNAAGSYIAGTWTSMPSMTYTRLYYASQVLKDGRVIVAGGEYGTGGARAELYDPVANTWTTINPPTTIMDPSVNSPVVSLTQQFYDGNSEILDNGNVLFMPVAPKSSGIPILYNPVLNQWANAKKLFRGSYQDEATWLKLPDDSILTIDPFGVNSERYCPAASYAWVNDSNVPVALYDSFGFEMGGGALLPNGKAIIIGSTGNTAIYTPTGTTSPGTWVAGPVIPNGRGEPDGPSCMMVNGKLLFIASAAPTSANHFPSPSYFYEYDYVTNTITQVPNHLNVANGSDNVSTYLGLMLQLPDGNVLYSHQNSDVYVYNPGGTPLAMGKPVVQSISKNGDGSFHLSGTGLNGINEGACYGDDWQMATNYPLVRINHSNGNTYYARTYNWSSTSVMTGSRVLTTEYKLPAGLPAGSYTLRVIGNGFASDAVTSPTVGTAPQSHNGCVGGSTTFTAAGAGTPAFTYQWRKGATVLTNGGNISGADTATLTINPIGPGDAVSNYNCVISNAVGSVTTGNAALTFCAADFNCDGFLDFTDFDDFVSAFESGSAGGDFNGDGFLDFTDFDEYVAAFDAGC